MKVVRSKKIAHNHLAELCWFPDTDTYDFVLVAEGDRIRILDRGYVDKDEIKKIWPEFLEECQRWVQDEVARKV